MLGSPPGSEARSGRVKEGMHTHPAELLTGNASENSADFMEIVKAVHTRGESRRTQDVTCAASAVLLPVLCADLPAGGQAANSFIPLLNRYEYLPCARCCFACQGFGKKRNTGAVFCLRGACTLVGIRINE